MVIKVKQRIYKEGVFVTTDEKFTVVEACCDKLFEELNRERFIELKEDSDGKLFLYVDYFQGRWDGDDSRFIPDCCYRCGDKITFEVLKTDFYEKVVEEETITVKKERWELTKTEIPGKVIFNNHVVITRDVDKLFGVRYKLGVTYGNIGFFTLDQMVELFGRVRQGVEGDTRIYHNLDPLRIETHESDYYQLIYTKDGFSERSYSLMGEDTVIIILDNALKVIEAEKKLVAKEEEE